MAEKTIEVEIWFPFPQAGGILQDVPPYQQDGNKLVSLPVEPVSGGGVGAGASVVPASHQVGG